MTEIWMTTTTNRIHETRSHPLNEDDETAEDDPPEVLATTRSLSPTLMTTRPGRNLDLKDNLPIISMEIAVEPLTFWKNMSASC